MPKMFLEEFMDVPTISLREIAEFAEENGLTNDEAWIAISRIRSRGFNQERYEESRTAARERIMELHMLKASPERKDGKTPDLIAYDEPLPKEDIPQQKKDRAYFIRRIIEKKKNEKKK
jgi:hypothetical protein